MIKGSPVLQATNLGLSTRSAVVTPAIPECPKTVILFGNHCCMFGSVAQSCPTLCYPMDCRMPGLLVHHQDPEPAKTHVHWVSDAIQPSHPLSSPSPPAFNLSQHQGLFFLSFFLILFYFLALQYCIGFTIYQHESTTGIHMFPILNPPPSSLPYHPIWVSPMHQPQASSIVHQTWTGDLFHIWYYTCFNAILPNHPTLSLSHRVQKTVLYISVSFAVVLWSTTPGT